METFEGLLRDETKIARTFTGGSFEWRDASGTVITNGLTALGTFGGAFSFDNVAEGSLPTDLQCGSGAGTLMGVVNEAAGHQKVLRASVTTIRNTGEASWSYKPSSSHSTGTISVWRYVTSVNQWCVALAFYAFRLYSYQGYWWTYSNDGLHTQVPTVTPVANRWQHIQLTLTADNNVLIYIDGVLVRTISTPWDIDTAMGVWGGVGATSLEYYSAYWDAIDYSWADGYTSYRNARDLGQLGAYEATQSFEDNALVFGSSFPSDACGTWSAPSYGTQIVEEIVPQVPTAATGHHNVMRLWTSTSYSEATYTLASAPASLSVEFWAYYTAWGSGGGGKICHILRSGTLNTPSTWGPMLGVSNAGGLLYFTGGAWNSLGVSLSLNSWYHYSVVADCATDKFSVYVNGVPRGANLAFASAQASLNNIFFNGAWDNSEFFIDALDISMDPQYFAGRSTFQHLLSEFTPQAAGQCAYRFSLAHAAGTKSGEWVPLTVQANDAPEIILNPMGADFQGTYSFADEVIGQVPSIGQVHVGGGGTVAIAGDIAGHANVLRYYVPASGSAHADWRDYWCGSHVTGTVEFWAYVVAGGRSLPVDLRSGEAGYAFGVEMKANGHVWVHQNGGWYETQTTFTADAWHHCRITFDCSANLARFFLDGGKVGGDYSCSGQTSTKWFDTWVGGFSNGETIAYLDALGYSWAPTYTFANEISDQAPSVGQVNIGGGGTVTIAEEMAGHARVLRYSVPAGPAGSAHADWRDYWPTSHTSGSVEFCAYISNGGRSFPVYLNSPTDTTVIGLDLNERYIAIKSDGQWTTVSGTFTPGTWHHCRITFDCSANLARFFLDGVQVCGDRSCSGQASAKWFGTWVEGFTYDVTACYLDDLYYSWSPNYEIGDNLRIVDSGTAKMYQASVGFDGGQIDVGEINISGGGAVTIEENLAGHAKVLKFSAPASESAFANWRDYGCGSHAAGTVEFWTYVASGSHTLQAYLRTGETGLVFGVELLAGGHVIVHDSSSSCGWTETQTTFAGDAWHHCRITFDCAANLARFFLDGVQVGGVWTCCGQSSVSWFDPWVGGFTYGETIAYLDALGYSWDAAYQQYDNLHPAGLSMISDCPLEFLCSPSLVDEQVLSWTLRDAVTGQAFYALYLDNNPTAIQSGTWGDGSAVTLDLGTLTLATGQHTFTLEAHDNDPVEDHETIDEVSILVDCLPTSTCPADFSYVLKRDSPTLQWTIYDADITPSSGGTWEVRHDGVYHSSGSFTSNGQVISITCGMDSLGVHIYELFVDDGLAGVRHLDTVQVTVAGIRERWAVIVGISDYKVISDLYAGDNDANYWSSYLNLFMGYDHIRVLGDTTSYYPAEYWYRYACETNVKNSLAWLAGADSDDVVSFIFCGHGSGPTGSSSLCTWDCNGGESGQDGWLYDTELDDYVGSWSAQNIFIFLASCHSGGFIPEIQALSNSAHIYMTTTCTQAGYGWDFGNYMAWTKSFLLDGLWDHFGSNPATTMEECFAYALPGYPCTGPEYEGGTANTPQQFDGNLGSGFTL